ncbi:hypothetical protein E2C01_067412 [Portunus trituberculatus]|uniref:Uncharacterized protein n=1 Tax=Portunus trituberculatus TaxID=210409 RepID=A0A5B7HXE2_PORTR|nr:hypothetical protein [Portunus trituberculatus]
MWMKWMEEALSTAFLEMGWTG